MTYKQLQDEALLLKFNEGNRASVKSWLNLRYAAIWAKADWHFKHVRGANLSVTGADTTPTMPSDFAKVEALYDANGDELEWVTPLDYDGARIGSTATGNPDIYTVVDREIHLYPIPSGNSTFTLAYQRRLSHVDGSTGLAAAGVMVNDSDSPLWPAEFDYLLVLEAQILGCRSLDFPTGELPEERDDLLRSLKSDWLHWQQASGIRIWGAA